ncbi:MAG: hypothetical protein AAF389_12315 [Gemmatimonadota bacterium]
MKSSSRLAALLVAAPLLAGCFTVAPMPVPPTAPQREDVALRGVVVREANGTEEEVRFDEVHEVTWTNTSLSVVADVTDASGATQTVTELYPISTLSALLVRQLDAGKTSAIIGGAIVGTAAFIATVVSGTSDPAGGGS